MTDITMRQMLEAGVHFGHQTRYWSPKMAPFIYGIRHNIHIINLEETLPRFRQALNFIYDSVSKRGRVMFVGTKHAARNIVREEASRCGMPYVDYRWLGGMLTNYKTIRQSIKRLKELEDRLSDEKNLSGMTKKEVLNLVREKDKLHVNLSGIKNMGGLPDILFVIDVGNEKIAVKEAQRLGIPVMAIVDTNCDPEGIDYPIPGNDDAIRSIRFYCSTIADTVLEAKSSLELAMVKEDGEKEEEVPVKKKIITRKSKVLRTGEEASHEEDEEEAVVEKPAKKAVAKKRKPVASKVDATNMVDTNPGEEG